MANSVIGALRVMLGMDTSEFETSAGRASKRVRDMGSEFSRVAAGMQRAGLALATAFAGVAGGMLALTRNTVNVADEISKSAAKIGIGAEELSRLKYAADLSGLSFEQLEKGLLTLNRNMAGIGGESGKVADAFARMGIETRNADGSLKSTTEILALMADAFAAMPDGAEKSALAMAVLGKAGADMIPLINGGSGALRQLTAEAAQFGIVIDAETGRKAEEFNDNLSRLQGIFQALSARIAADMLPRLIELQNWLLNNQAAIANAARSAVEFATSLIGVLRSLSPLIGGVLAYRGAIVVTNAAMAVFNSTIFAVAARVGVLTTAQLLAARATQTLTSALARNPFGAVAVAVGVLSASFIGLANAQAQARAETNNLIASLKAAAAARSADFASLRSKAALDLNRVRAERDEIEANRNALLRGAGISPSDYESRNLTDLQRARLRGIADALKNLNGQLTESGRAMVGLESQIELADEAFQNAGKAAESIVIPTNRGATAIRQVGGASADTSKALRDMTKSAQDSASQLAALMDRLFPAVAQARKLREEFALIDQASNLTEDQKAEARFRLRTEGLGDAFVSPWLKRNEAIIDLKDQSMIALDELASKSEVQTVRIAQTFADMARNVSNALRGLVEGIRGGGFFDILDGLIGLGTTLGGAGLFGKGVQARLLATPGFADGGAMMLGGLAGIDRNVLSLNGSPIARVSAGETMEIRRGDRGGGAREVVVRIVDTTGLFKTEVEGAAVRVVSAAAPSIAKAGASQALDRLRRVQDMSLA